ncbi:MAG: pilus assembly protein PilB, partial [Nitrospirota bacterium]
MARPTLLEVLVRHGLAREPIEQALRRLGGVSLALGQTLVSEGVLSEEQLAKALAEQYGLPYDPLTDFRVD